MKKLTLLLLFGFLGISGFAQSIENGKLLFEQGDYERAILIFERIDTDESKLFLGKSHFGLNNYLKASSYLNQVSRNANQVTFQDAQYTLALSYFQLDDFAQSLDVLEALMSQTPTSPITRSANELYDDILGFLTPKQRFDTFKELNSDEARLDLVESTIGIVDYQTLSTLLELYKKSIPEYNEMRVNRIETVLNDSVGYWNRYNPNALTTAPRGMSYNIGVALPEFEFDSPEYEIPQHLYFGIQLAVEQFNRETANQKAFITYRNTSDVTKTASSIVGDMVWNENVDVILGPLFSQVAKEFSNAAEQYEIPVVLPLANADSLDLYNNYVFQLNPAFGAQGRVMANYAVNELGYDTLGVIAEKGSLGDPAARAFRHEAERNEGFVQYYFVEDLGSLGFDIRDYTQFFTSDTLDSIPMVKAVYAPFTGTIAPTLIEAMLTGLEAMNSTVAILGSEEWQNIDLDQRRLDSTLVYYTESFNVDTSITRAAEFISEFRIRFQTEPNDFAFIGYDAASIVLNELKLVKNPKYLRESLMNLNDYHGLSIDVSFNGTHVNHDIKVSKVQRESDLELLEDESSEPDQRRR